MMMIKSEHTTTGKMRKKLPIQPVSRTRDGKRPGGDDVLGLHVSWSIKECCEAKVAPSFHSRAGK